MDRSDASFKRVTIALSSPSIECRLLLTNSFTATVPKTVFARPVIIYDLIAVLLRTTIVFTGIFIQKFHGVGTEPRHGAIEITVIHRGFSLQIIRTGDPGLRRRPFLERDPDIWRLVPSLDACKRSEVSVRVQNAEGAEYKEKGDGEREVGWNEREKLCDIDPDRNRKNSSKKITTEFYKNH